MIRSSWLPATLIVSLAFNIAAVGSVVYSRYSSARAASRSTCQPLGPSGPTLAPEQAAQVALVRQQFEAKAAPLRAAYLEKNAELAELAVTGSPADAPRIDQLSRDVAELHRQIQLLAVDSLRREAELVPSCQRETYSSALRSRICSADGDAGCGCP